jgi:hypothetical protein
MKVIHSSEMSVDIQWTALQYIPEDSTLHNYCCENLKSYKSICINAYIILPQEGAGRSSIGCTCLIINESPLGVPK